MKTKTTPIDFTDSCLARFPLLYAFVRIWEKMRPVFAQDRVHELGLEIAFGLLTSFGRRTISRGIWARSYKWALRFITFSALIAPYGMIAEAKSIIIKLKVAPTLVKPRKKDPPQAHKKYNKDKKSWSLATQAAEQILLIRAQMDAIPTLIRRLLVIVADSSYTNEIVFRHLPRQCIYIGRTRKDLKLFALASARPGGRGRTKKYGDQLPTPEEIRKSDKYPWQKCVIFAAGRHHDLRYKVLTPVLWKKAGYARPVMLIVIEPLAYRLTKNSKLLYREPAYLLVSEPDYPAHLAIQHYFHRWQIEVNHRMERDSPRRRLKKTCSTARKNTSHRTRTTSNLMNVRHILPKSSPPPRGRGLGVG